MSKLHFLYYTTADRPRDEGFEAWRRLMAPMYDIRPGSHGRFHPGGSTIAYLLGDILANRTIFSAQHVARDRKRVETTPDHILFQLWRTGGYVGDISGQPVTVDAGAVALSDRRRTLDVRFAPSDTIGLIVPRTLLAGIDLESLGLRFDPARNRLFTGRISALYRQMPHTDQAEIPALRAELTAFLLRILDRSMAADALEGPELDGGLMPLAERTIRAGLARPDLSPDTIAAEMRISRATLYRLFAPRGGVMHDVHAQRLLAVRDALADPLETRTLTRLAADHGINSLAHLSRTFRARFDVTPRSWRAHHRAHARLQAQHTPEPFWRWFNGLGRRERV